MRLALILLPMAALAASGEAVYQKRCAGCHDQTSDRIPPRSALQKMPAERIQRALDAGAMMAIGFTLNHDDRVAVASWLGTSTGVAGPPAAAFCADRTVNRADTPRSAWNGWSPGTSNTRFQTAAAAGLTLEQVHGLKLK